MAPKKKNSSNKSLLQRRQKLCSQAGKAFHALLYSTRSVKNIFITGGRRIITGIKKFPRPLKIFAIYIMLLLLVGGVFIWRTAQMGLHRHTYPFTQDFFEEETEEETVEKPEQAETNVEPSDDLGKEEKTQPEPDSGQESSDHTPEEVASPISTIWPIQGNLIYGFGDIKVAKIAGSNHYAYSKGIAISAEPGTTVSSIWDGTVTGIRDLCYPYGKSVTIAGPEGLEATYGALETVTVSPGNTVTCGQEIGTVARGYEPDPSYLYLQITKAGIGAVDPLIYLPSR